MASYNVSAFSTLYDGFTLYQEGDRGWSIVNNHLYSPTPLSLGGGCAYINTNAVDLNGTLRVAYDNLNSSNQADYNGIVLRYIDQANFIAFRIDSRDQSISDSQTVFVSTNNFSDGAKSIVPMYNALGVPISVSPYNVVDVPSSGNVKITIHDDYKYDIEIYDTSNIFKCSGTYTDTRSNKSVNGKTGFYHVAEWNTGWNTAASPYGWKSISWNDATVAATAPTIQSYTVTPPSIVQGDTASVCWYVTSGNDNTTVKFAGSSVALSGCSAVAPSSNRTYNLSAWNSAGSVSADVLLTVAQHLPIITYLSASSTVISPYSGTNLFWSTNYASSAVADVLGWTVYPTSGVNNVVSAVFPLVTTTYGLSAYAPGNIVPATSAITITVVPDPIINSFTTDGKTCKNSYFGLYWNATNAVSGSILNLSTFQTVATLSAASFPIGQISISAAQTTDYLISVYNYIGANNGSVATHYINVSPPTLSAEAYNSGSRIPDGGSVDITSIDGAQILIDTAGTFDPDGDSTTYKYFVNNSLISQGTDSTATYIATTAATNDFVVSATDNCGNTTSAGIRVYTTTNINPLAVITNTDMTIVNPLTITLSGSSSVAYTGKTITNYVWYTGANLDIPFSYVADPIVTLSVPGIYKYKLYVVDSGTLSDYSDVLTITYSSNTYGLSANAGADQKFCVVTGNTVPVVSFDASGSTGASSYYWDLAAFGVSAIVSAATATVSNVGAGNKTASLTVKNIAGVVDFDMVSVNISNKPEILGGSMGYVVDAVFYPPSTDHFIDIPCGTSFKEVTLAALCSNYHYSLLNIKWEKSGLVWNGSSFVTSYTTLNPNEYIPVVGNETIYISATPQYFQGNPYYQSYRSTASLISNPNCYFVSDPITLKVRALADDLKLSMTVTPQVINTDGFTYDPITISWNVLGSDHVWLGTNGTFDSVDPVDSTMAVITHDQTIVLSATTNAGCSKTYSIPVIINEGNFNVCKLKERYIALYAPEIIRFGNNRKISLKEFFDYFQDREIFEVIGMFEQYLNTMYVGEQGFVTSAAYIPTVQTTTVDEYLRSQFYKYEGL